MDKITELANHCIAYIEPYASDILHAVKGAIGSLGTLFSIHWPVLAFTVVALVAAISLYYFLRLFVPTEA